MEDDPLLGKVMFDQLELRAGDSDTSVNWDMDGWLGKDLHKFWFKSEGDYEGGSIGEAELQALYSRAIAPSGTYRQAGVVICVQTRFATGWLLGSREWLPIFSILMRLSFLGRVAVPKPG